MQKKRLLSTVAAIAIGIGLFTVPSVSAVNKENSMKQTNDWTLVLQENFDDGELNTTVFSDSYLPHWTTYEQSLAHYDIQDGILSLKIEKDGQVPWWHGSDVQKVSSIQTGMRDGMHLFWDSCYITEHHRAVTNFETKYGYFELRARVPSDGGLHSAWWMIGNETRAKQNAEIDIFEICGPDCKSNKSRVRVSVHPWDDDNLSEQSLDYYPACNVSNEFHVYGFEWLPSGMKFYFDGQLVKETTQSPDYPMATLLGIYENNAPLWSGTIDPNGKYPKRFEIDYFRIYKTAEMIAADEEAKKPPVLGENIAPYAVPGAGQDWAWSSPLSNMIDNNAYTAMQSQNAPAFPQYLYFDWNDTQVFDTVVLKSSYANGQAPTNWDIEISADGENNWTKIASSGDVEWDNNDWHIEEHALNFPKAEAKALRVKINSANLQWKHYAINEILVYDDTAQPNNIDLAEESTPELESSNGGFLTDGNRKTAVQSKNRPTFPQEVNLKWSRPIAFNQIQMHCWYALHQAPTSVSIEVSSNGYQWEEIVPASNLDWLSTENNIEVQTFNFETVTNIRYLKLRIYDANLKWKHFAINELEVYHAAE